MVERLIRLLLGGRWVVLVSLAVVVVLSAVSVSRISFDNSIESWFLDEDPSLAVYDHFTETFNADQIVIVGIFADDVFDADVLVAIDRISVAAAHLKFADRVQSITHSSLARRIGGLDTPNFREQILASPLQRNVLLSPDSSATAIVIHYAREGNTFRKKHEFVTALREIVRDATVGTDIDHAITGAPVLGDAGQTRNNEDLRILIPAMIFVIVVIAFGLFQSVAMTLLPLGVSSVAVVFAYGLMAAVEWKMTMISVILIPLILAVGVAHSIHVISRYRLNLESGLDNEAAVVDSIKRLIKPCFFTSITTVIGLLSLLVSSLEPVHEFAVTSAAGVFAAFVVSMTFLPVMLLMRRRKLRQRLTFARVIVDKLLALVHRAASAHPRKIVLLGLAAGVGFTWFAMQVEARLDPMSWIRHDDPIRIDTQRIDGTFGGALSLEFLLTSPEGRLNEPDILRRMAAFQDWLVDNTKVGQATSIADLVKEAARVARDADEGGFSLPRTRFLTDELLSKLRSDEQLGPWVTPGFTEARIAARVPLSSAQEIIDEIPAIQQRIAEDFDGSGVTVALTGHAVLASKMQTYMLDSQLRSFAVALAVVSLMMILLLRSTALGLLAMIPNLLPIAVGLGAMTLLDIPLSPATVMIAAVALGIVVDDTVHLMTAFERGVRSTGKVGVAIRSTLLEVGQPVTVTSVLLATGFATLILGGFLPTRQVGGLVAVIVVAALITDLVFLPAILRSLPDKLITESLGWDGRSGDQELPDSPK
jgi:hydrophobe/amphiphile efflux-3 (HAE3) family protein